MQIKDQVIGGYWRREWHWPRTVRAGLRATGARGIVVADLDEAGATHVAQQIGGLAVRTDVSKADDLKRLVAAATEKFGPIDLFCSNAGIETGGGIDAAEDLWQKIWSRERDVARLRRTGRVARDARARQRVPCCKPPRPPGCSRS